MISKRAHVRCITCMDVAIYTKLSSTRVQGLLCPFHLTLLRALSCEAYVPVSWSISRQTTSVYLPSVLSPQFIDQEHKHCQLCLVILNHGQMARSTSELWHPTELSSDFVRLSLREFALTDLTSRYAPVYSVVFLFGIGHRTGSLRSRVQHSTHRATMARKKCILRDLSQTASKMEVGAIAIKCAPLSMACFNPLGALRS